MKISSEVLRAVQLCQLDCMVQLDRVCREQGLTYYLIEGTLLGAIRHKGFIPWDDDLDIGMPRDDYNILMEKGKQWLGDRYFLQTWRTDKDYYAPFAKVRVNGTIFREKSTAHLDVHHGVYVDIFPIDQVSSNKMIRKMDRFVLSILRHLIQRKLRVKNVSNQMVVWLGTILSLFFKKKFLFSSIDQYLQKRSGKQTEWVSNVFGAYRNKEECPQLYFGKPREVEFEGYSFCSPQEPEKILAQLYGDYMQPPPEEKRGGAHPVTEVMVGDVYEFSNQPSS